MTFLFVGVKVKDFTKDFNNKDFIKDFTMDFTNFYGFLKKMVQKNQYTYNVPPGSSENPYGEARSAEFDGSSKKVFCRNILTLLGLLRSILQFGGVIGDSDLAEVLWKMFCNSTAESTKRTYSVSVNRSMLPSIH